MLLPTTTNTTTSFLRCATGEGVSTIIVCIVIPPRLSAKPEYAEDCRILFVWKSPAEILQPAEWAIAFKTFNRVCDAPQKG